MHQNNKTFLPNAHLSKIVLFLNTSFLAYVFNVKSILRYAIS